LSALPGLHPHPEDRVRAVRDRPGESGGAPRGNGPRLDRRVAGSRGGQGGEPWQGGDGGVVPASDPCEGLVEGPTSDRVDDVGGDRASRSVPQEPPRVRDGAGPLTAERRTVLPVARQRAVGAVGG